MPVSTRCSSALFYCFRTIHKVVADLCQFVLLFTRPRIALAAESLFLRKQLALFQKRRIKPHRAQDSTRWLMAVRSHLFDWESASRREPLESTCPRSLPRDGAVIRLSGG